MKKWMRTETFAAWAFMAPGLLIVAVFVLWPIVYGLPLSLTDYSVIGETHYVGVDNYVTAFQDKSFLASLWNSMVYVLIVPIIQIISILMAILVNSRIPLIKAFRAAYYIPVVTSMVAVALMWSWLFSSNGVINYALIQLGVIQEQVGWLSSSSTALYVIMFITMWKGLGYYMMLYLAGLQSIPTDLYEASMIDGASRWQTIYRITIPLLRPHILFCTLISLMGAIRVFDEVFVLTNGKGGPGTATLTSSLYIYQKGLVQFNFGYASALGLIVSVIVGILSILVFRLNKKGGVQTY